MHIQSPKKDFTHQEAMSHSHTQGAVWYTDTPVELRLWSSSCEGRKPVGLEGWECESTGAVLGVARLWLAVISKEPKASCHSRLNSSAPTEPGLSRSFKKFRSPRSRSSSWFCCRTSESRSLEPVERSAVWHTARGHKHRQDMTEENI